MVKLSEMLIEWLLEKGHKAYGHSYLDPSSVVSIKIGDRVVLIVNDKTTVVWVHDFPPGTLWTHLDIASPTFFSDLEKAIK